MSRRFELVRRLYQSSARFRSVSDPTSTRRGAPDVADNDSMDFDQLINFVESEMSMSHVYQSHRLGWQAGRFRLACRPSPFRQWSTVSEVAIRQF
jgi:hypothetical protein